MKTIASLLLIFALSGSGQINRISPKIPGVNHRISTVAKTGESVCDIFSESYLKNVFPDAENFKARPRDKPYPGCTYHFDAGGKLHYAGVTLVEKFGSEKNLERSMQSFSDKEPVSGLGQKAYYIPKLGQVSVWSGTRLIHVFVQIEEKGDKEKAVRIAGDIIAKL